MQLRAFILVALSGVLLPAANVAANPTVHLASAFAPTQADTAALQARGACDGATEIDIKFDVNLDGETFAKCNNVNYQTWKASTTPGDFAWCRTEWTKCSGTHSSGVCNRANVFCEAARQYCSTLKGDFICY
ncbi:hypothetical protein IEO21_08829 [Rhodonia placenta]|uniref:Uncharacterized protein n=1 Tax=Rhodonia placenta TaxID=104341 RepID=A0A8H7NVQ7_9APHY|nr:hypothetical protein IEO21_08829 [Postia placenta]